MLASLVVGVLSDKLVCSHVLVIGDPIHAHFTLCVGTKKVHHIWIHVIWPQLLFHWSSWFHWIHWTTVSSHVLLSNQSHLDQHNVTLLQASLDNLCGIWHHWSWRGNGQYPHLRWYPKHFKVRFSYNYSLIPIFQCVAHWSSFTMNTTYKWDDNIIAVNSSPQVNSWWQWGDVWPSNSSHIRHCLFHTVLWVKLPLVDFALAIVLTVVASCIYDIVYSIESLWGLLSVVLWLNFLISKVVLW
jgi:hypothetical protein